jgi:hypothetical protein
MSSDNIDDLIDKIAKGSKKNKQTEKNKNINYDDVDFGELDTKTKKVYTDLFTGMPDLYKLVGASQTDPYEVIKKKCTEKLAKYHPDKIAPMLMKFPVGEREAEKKKFAMQYKLIKEAYSTLRDPEKKKYYDLQRKTIDSKNFFKQKDSFDDFIKLQDSEISEQTKKNADGSFKLKMLELDERHGFNRKDLDKKPISKKKAEKKMGDLMMEREQQDIEYQPKNMFGDGKQYNATDFNKQWEKMKKYENRKSKNKTGGQDGSIVQWEGISAANDMGMGGSTDYVSINSNYEDLYSTDKFAGTGFADKLDSENSDSDFRLSDISDDDIDTSYVTNHNKDKGDIMKKFQEYENFRKNEDIEYDNRQFTDKSWKNVMDNPFNVSAQVGSMVGGDVKQLEGPRRKKKIEKDMAEAYKQLIYDSKSDK